MEEIWKPVVQFEASHEVSSHGRVRTVPRTFTGGRMRLDGTRSVMSISQKELRARLIRRGYLAVDLQCDGRKVGRVIHRLVAEAFLGPAPSARHEVNHVDGDKLNNRLDNLMWCTPKENSQHAYDTGLKAPIIGEQVHTAKLTEQDVREIRCLLLDGQSQRSIARQFGVASPQINRIAKGTSWRHVD